MASDNNERTAAYIAALLRHIAKGRLDPYLDDIRDSLNNRHRSIRDQRAAHNRVIMKPGVRVKIANTIKPRYLAGLKGTVMDPEDIGHLPRGQDRNIPVRLDYGRIRRYGPTVFVPPSALAKLKDQTPHPDHGYTPEDTPTNTIG